MPHFKDEDKVPIER